MKPGPKPKTPSQKAIAGTFRPDRDGHRFEIVAPNSLPVEPDGLTDAGRRVWRANVGRTSATELDSELFANWCDLQAAIHAVFRAGDVPSAAHLSEARRTAELLGLAGDKSRVVAGKGPVGVTPFDFLLE